MADARPATNVGPCPKCGGRNVVEFNQLGSTKRLNQCYHVKCGHIWDAN